jgi:hypothetical protein
MHKSKRKWNCIDCGRCTKLEHYFVESTVWFEEANMPEEGMLCVADLEKRIKRILLPSDFTDAHINDPRRNSMTDLLRSRILGLDLALVSC